MASDFEPGASTGNPAGFIAESIRNGVNATQSLNAYREAGGSVTTQYWYPLYGNVADTLARSESAAGLDPFQVPNAADYGVWSLKGQTGYATDVNVFIRDIESGQIGTRRYTYKTRDPHAPGEAQLAAMVDYGSADVTGEGDTGQGQAVMGATTANVYRIQDADET